MCCVCVHLFLETTELGKGTEPRLTPNVGWTQRSITDVQFKISSQLQTNPRGKFKVQTQWILKDSKIELTLETLPKKVKRPDANWIENLLKQKSKKKKNQYSPENVNIIQSISSITSKCPGCNLKLFKIQTTKIM